MKYADHSNVQLRSFLNGMLYSLLRSSKVYEEAKVWRVRMTASDAWVEGECHGEARGAEEHEEYDAGVADCVCVVWVM
jgi:hypothetical protein